MIILEIDEGIIRGKYSTNAQLEELLEAHVEGPFVDDKVGAEINLPAEPVYDDKGNIIGGTHRPDLLPPIPIPPPTNEERLTAMEDAISALMGV